MLGGGGGGGGWIGSVEVVLGGRVGVGSVVVVGLMVWQALSSVDGGKPRTQSVVNKHFNQVVRYGRASIPHPSPSPSLCKDARSSD